MLTSWKKRKKTTVIKFEKNLFKNKFSKTLYFFKKYVNNFTEYALFPLLQKSN